MRAKLSMLFLFTASLVLARNPSQHRPGGGDILSLDPSIAASVCAVLGLAVFFAFASSYHGTVVRFAVSVGILFAGPAAIAESYLWLNKPSYCCLCTPSLWDSPWLQAIILWFVGAALLLLAVRILGRKERRDFAHCAVGAVFVLSLLVR